MIKIDQHSSSNCSRIDQTSIKHRSNSRLGWGSGRNLAPERVLGGVWGGSWVIIEANMFPTWVPRWSPNRRNIDAKIDLNLMPFGIVFWMDFGGFWKQSKIKLAPKSIPTSMITSKSSYLKIIILHMKTLIFNGSVDPS